MLKQLVKFLLVLVLVLMPFTLVGCDGDDSSSNSNNSSSSREDEPTEASSAIYTNAADFESDLKAGKDLTGAEVTFEIRKLIPDSAFGYNVVSGEHLNFVSEDNPNVEVGNTLTVKVVKIKSVAGSWVISYKRID